MTSSMLSGDRSRWAPSRRGGMTVLGKVTVPKPINLPSQRLENHGLDPNVEIVPKGTLSWGSRSSSASNAWGSSSLSPNTDGGSSSPSRLSARPSSGGSGTRPSTAGSDKALEPTANAWGSNSRPSSASGALSTNQSSLTSLRPRSAETRPGSSQLSRFAESLAENSTPWSAARTAEKLGVTQARNEEFSLSSGDFPTLGSEKDKSVKNSELQDHNFQGRPGSSSGLGKEKNETSADAVSVNANVKGGMVNSWGGDYPAHSGDGVKPGMEKWQGNPQPYPSAGIAPQHYDAWHGPPVNNPQGGVWFRGPPGGPPFGNPVAPGGFPIEPFPYYRPHIPPTGLVNPPPGPPQGAGPRGHRPKNGDVYRPHMPDSYIRPGVPFRPGFYPGPMTYDGYYGPPMGYNERDIPYMGMSTGPSVYNRYSNQNPDEPGNLQGRSDGYVSSGKPSPKPGESSHLPDTGGPYRVLLKQHNDWDGKNEPSNWEDSDTKNAYVDGRDQNRMPVWENEQRSEYRMNEEMNLRTSACGEEAFSQASENRGSSFSGKADYPGSTGNIKTSVDISARKLDGTDSGVQVPLRPFSPKKSSLIQKIEGLNAKARDNSSAKSREEQRNKCHAGSALVNHVENGVGAGVVFPERTCATEVINSSPREVGASGGEKNIESLSFSGTVASRRPVHGMQGRADHRNKGRFNSQDPDGWQKKSVEADSSTLSGSRLEASNVHVGDHCISIETSDRSGPYHQTRHDGESVQSMSDPIAGQAQRAKMKELAKQRTKQLQEEEEERTRKQKAKALAKLDELNRRTQAGEGLSQKEEDTISPLHNKAEELQASESTYVSGKSGAANLAIMCSTNVVRQISETGINKVKTSPILSGEPTIETLDTGKESVHSHNQSVTLYQDVNSAEATSAIQVHGNVAAKQKRVGYKQKPNLPSNEKFISATTASPSVENGTVVDVAVSSGIVVNEVNSADVSGFPMNSTAMPESSTNQKKKNNKNGKNKNKVEETSSLVALRLATPKEANLSRTSVGSDEPKASNIEVEQGSVQPTSLSKDPNQYSEQRRNSPNEESHGRLNNQWKSQHCRRMPRNMVANRPVEKSHGSDAVIWAPVKPQNKMEIVDESSDEGKIEPVNPVKGDQQVHNNLKNKRAEIERYIPKPVAKELAQQGSVQQVASSINEAPTDEFDGRVDSGSQGPQISRHFSSPVVKMASGMESKNGDGRQTKQGKAHGSWRQRGSTESTYVHDAQDGLNSDPNGDQSLKRSSEQQHIQKSEMSSAKGQTKQVIDSTDPDGSNNPNNQDSTAQVSTSIKDQAATGRGRRGSYRGNKGMGTNHDVDQKKHGGEAEKTELLNSSEPGQLDIGASLKENRVVGERLTSHWQPKSQTSSNQRGSRPNDRNVGSEASQVTKKESTHGSLSLPAGIDKESNMHVAQPHHNQPVSEKGKAGEATIVGNHEAKRERRNAPPKGCSHSPSHVVVSSVEPSLTSMDLRHEQRPSSGFRKNGNQNRFGRGHESRGDWKSPGQDSRYYNQPTNRERQGHNMQYEYLPVGPYDNSKSDNSERPKDGNHNGGRYREKSQTHSRRGGGNFYGRQGGGFD